ncbi:S41 family peptidase [Paenibacillus harenae]|uniref:Carboxyl-terminal processing protease n=1 Tax=Paenibacillus harenae TaxID=306543 RepID=A0ABT9UAF0_PAEHA|nr:S41 family peptidase [Paenibacillus harenae]MDQ0116583.1 carboxyl-terminal processing protease [Paenibacillus harenae]
MQFKGRTVFAFVMLTMFASVLVTLTIADKLIDPKERAEAALTAAASDRASRYGLKEDELTKLNAVLELIETKYYEKVDRHELVDGAVNGMMSSLEDPYSVYMEKEVAQHFSESIEGSFTGIGAEVTMENGKIIVVAPIKGSPAERSGLLAKDVVISVNGEKLDGLSLQEAVAKIRGPKGTKAKLQVLRSGFSEPVQLVLVRDDIDVETVYANLRKDGIGVIEIRQFSLHTAERFKEELTKLEQQGMKGLVIDVRNNPGGILPVVVDIAESFLAKGQTVVQVEDRSGEREKTLSEGESKTYPISVLMNKGSASASEILAGALQEGAGAKLIGETSFGKGTVQVSYNKALGDGSLVKMTIAKWLTPNGNWIHEKGIKPDIEVQPPDLYTVARLSMSDTLQQDMLGEQVRSVQIMLHGLGYEPKREDGYFGLETKEAVKRFQSEHSLKVTGKVDVKTAEALEQAVIKWIQDENNDVQLHEAIQAAGRK